MARVMWSLSSSSKIVGFHAFCQEYFTMGGQQQKAVKTFMQRLIRGGVVDPWEWPRLQEKWLQDIRVFQ